MNERTIFKRRIQQLSKKIASDYDFTLYKRTFLIKEESDIVCMIVFDFPPTAMQFSSQLPALRCQHQIRTHPIRQGQVQFLHRHAYRRVCV